VLLEFAFEFGESAQLPALVPADPARADLVDGDRVQVVELLASAPHDDDEVRRLQDVEVLRDRLTRDVLVGAEFAERLAVARVQAVEQRAAARVGKGTEDGVQVHQVIMQRTGCMSTPFLGVANRRCAPDMP
jgi:hypothetical protein